MWVTRVDKSGIPYVFTNDTNTMTECGSQKPSADFAWCYTFDAANGILSVTMNMGFSDFAQNYAKAIGEHCQPQSYCSWNGKSCGCTLKAGDPGTSECQNACTNWATKAIDCPDGGCYGFAVALPSDFVASGNTTTSPPGQCLPNNPAWNVPFTAASSGTAGSCFYSMGLPTSSFCSSAGKR